MREVWSKLRSRAIPAIVVLFLGAVAFLPICDLHFDCGCKALGFGAADHCDIHTAGPPDCPWCAHSWTGYAAMVFSAALGLAAVWFLPRDMHIAVVTVAGFGALLAAALIAGVVTSLWFGLPVLAGL